MGAPEKRNSTGVASTPAIPAQTKIANDRIKIRIDLNSDITVPASPPKDANAAGPSSHGERFSTEWQKRINKLKCEKRRLDHAHLPHRFKGDDPREPSPSGWCAHL
jgi:hypothetical protein